MKEFEGRVAVVTGAASGMGKAFAERFAQEGMKVVLADYEKDALDAAVKELAQKEFQVIGVVADVSSQQAVEDLAAKAIDAYGKVHILCNNAGVVADSELGGLGMGTARAIWEHPLSDWQWTFGVNFWGVVHGIRAFLPKMLEHGEPGHILNTSSIAGLTSGAGLPIYGATKHGVVRISEALHHQLAQRQSALKVSVLCPGGVNTRIASASRNRPDELWEGAQKLESSDLAARDQRWDNPQSMSPQTVAETVFNAIRDEQFYILTHNEYDGVIKGRMENILSRTNPPVAAF